MSSRNPDPRPLKQPQAAGRLNIAAKDLPDLGRPWSRDDVRALHADPPEWLTEARQRLATVTAAGHQSDREAVLKLSRRIQSAGWVTAEDGTDQAVALYDEIALRAHDEWGEALDMAYAAAGILLPQTSSWHNDDDERDDDRD